MGVDYATKQSAVLFIPLDEAQLSLLVVRALHRQECRRAVSITGRIRACDSEAPSVANTEIDVGDRASTRSRLLR